MDSKQNGWNDVLEKYVDSVQSECTRFASQHKQLAKLYQKRYQYVTVSLIIIPLTIGIVSLLPLKEHLIKSITGTLALVNVALAAFNKV